MSVTSGFFNSLNHDRRYNAQQMSALFDGIINDGVFSNIGTAFAISVDTGVTINIGKGRAWFNSAWIYNDALLPKTLEGSEVVLDRIDAVVIEVDHSEAVRMGDIKIIKGTPSSSPVRPTMVSTVDKHQYPLAYIYRKAGSTSITQADITNMVGTSKCPYITGILQVQNIDNIVAQWNAQWNQWYTEKIAETNSVSSELLAEMKSDFEIWFNDVRALLSDDVATALSSQVAELKSKFDDLARYGAVYDTVEDSNLDVILDSNGTPILGKTTFTGGFGGGSGGVLSGPIDSSGILDSAVTTEKLANESVTREKLANKSVTREKISSDALYSPVTNLTNATNSLTVDMLGKTVLFVNSDIDMSFTISKEISDTLPIGFEVALLYWSAKSAKVVFTGGIGVGIAGEGAIIDPTIVLPERYTMVAVKKCTDVSWLVTGSVEVIR